MRRFYIKQMDWESNDLSITGADANHIRNVLRLQVGDQIIIVDGLGNEHLTTIQQLAPGRVDVRFKTAIISNKESAVKITIGIAYLKHKKMDLVVRQTAELGVYQWLPFFASRSVPRPDDKQLAKRTARWELIAKEALKQCQRNRLMKINSPIALKDVLQRGRGFDLKVIFCPNQGGSITSLMRSLKPSFVQTIIALIGPEGGFTLEEIDEAEDSGFIKASLGPRILRSETAVVAVSTLLQHYFGDLD